MPNQVPMNQPINPLQKGSNTPYLIAVVVMVLIGVVAVLSIVLLRPDSDNSQLIATVLSMIVPTTAAILALMKSQETHLTVNSQLAQWKLDFADLKRAEGEKEGISMEQARVAELRKTVAAERPIAVAPAVAPAQAPAQAPVPVIVANPQPVPVVDVSEKKTR